MRITKTVVIPLRIHTFAVGTNVWVFTFIDVLTVVGDSVSSLSWWTLAGE